MKKKIKAWAIINKKEQFFMPVWISRGKVFSHMIFSNKESAEEVMKNKIYSKIGKIIEIKILKQ